VFEIQEGTLNEVKRMPEPVRLVKHAHGVARAKDGAQIPYTFVSAVKSPKKLLVIAYGAYGLSSKRAYPKRWLPWLTQGYAIVESAPRGGRENGDAWYDAARTAERKITTFTDVASVIKTVQERFHFKKEQTVVYGRSAGGWTAAYIGQNYSHRVGAVYSEVPYLDVIRTASNPRLPLTQLEYDEFGDPAHRPEEYEALRTISPVDSASTAPSKPAFFLVRTALHDSQVYPYEALKFAAKMRSLGWPIVVGMDRAGGHFVGKNEAARIYAEDFLLIDSALQSRGVARRKTVRRPRAQARSKLRSQTARGTKRRRASSRKH
jgi:oligopeptidase B